MSKGDCKCTCYSDHLVKINGASIEMTVRKNIKRDLTRNIVLNKAQF